MYRFARHSRFFGVLTALLVGYAVCWLRQDYPQMANAELIPASAGQTLVGSGGLISHFHQNDVSNQTRVILVDPNLRRMVVYDVPADSGKIQLRSVRNLTVDLQVQEYNSGEPSPIDMQKMLDRN